MIGYSLVMVGIILLILMNKVKVNVNIKTKGVIHEIMCINGFVIWINMQKAVAHKYFLANEIGAK